jgi:hypothetical protein
MATVKGVEFLGQLTRLLASQGGLCSMELSVEEHKKPRSLQLGDWAWGITSHRRKNSLLRNITHGFCLTPNHHKESPQQHQTDRATKEQLYSAQKKSKRTYTCSTTPTFLNYNTPVQRRGLYFTQNHFNTSHTKLFTRVNVQFTVQYLQHSMPMEEVH